MQGRKEDVWSLVKSVCVPAFLCALSAFLQFRWFWSWIKMDELLAWFTFTSHSEQ